MKLKGINKLEPHNIVFANLYVIMLFQICMNWKASNCGTSSNIWQLLLLLTAFARLIIDEAYNNKLMFQKTNTIAMLATTSILTVLAIYESIIIAENGQDFESGVCFQNRIVFIS
jgi:hypothetical protein